MTRRASTTAKTKQNLIDSFWQIYSTKRIEKITVREVAAKAGCNRGTFYEYFTDVYDVLEQIEVSLLAKQEQFPSVDLGATLAPRPIEDFVAMYEEHSKYYVVLLGENGDPSFLGRMKASLKPRLRQALVAQGATDDLEFDYTLEYTLSAMIGVLSYWFLQERKPPTENFLSLVGDITRNGVMGRLSAPQWPI